MSTTTLMTFLLRTSSNVRSVKLLGSWDNFSSPYLMERDKRIGSGHWRGCHTFKNIICDGEVNGATSSRDGGLKMGGTYWYYYQLDNEIEYHNPAEPSTTACPLLPGQTVNVLHVPMQIGSANRSREGSVSSTGSEHRTMNPEDKFLNPRPVPRPSLPKLTTSLSLVGKPYLASPFNTSPSSARSNNSLGEPSSATSTRSFRIPRKTSLGKSRSSRSVSPHRSGFRAALNQFTAPRSAGPEMEGDRGRRGARIERELEISSPMLLNRPDNGRLGLPVSAPASMTTSREVSPYDLPSRPRPRAPAPAPSNLPRHVREGDVRVNPLALHRIRSSRSRSRDPSPLRRSMSLEDDETRPLKESVLSFLKPLETLEEQNTPGIMPDNMKGFTEANTNAATLEELKEKRLPTLPNSPSSVLDEEMSIETPVPEHDEVEQHSHFSALTTKSAVLQPFELLEPPRSHFSEFSVRSMGSPSSTYSSTFDNTTPSLSGHTDHSSFPASPYHVPSMPETPYMNDDLRDRFSLTGSETPVTQSIVRDPAPTQDTTDDLDSHMKGLCIDSPNPPSSSGSFRPAALDFGFQGYKLPEIANDTDLTLKKVPTSDHGHATHAQQDHPYVQSSEDSTWDHIAQSNPHTTTMQQLMDELSYLGDMIQS